jgi:hypothetical protein
VTPKKLIHGSNHFSCVQYAKASMVEHSVWAVDELLKQGKNEETLKNTKNRCRPISPIREEAASKPILTNFFIESL